MSVTVGSTVTVEWVPSWDAAGHSVSLTVVKPDGTSITPTPAGTGPFTAEVTADQVGRYVLRWTDTTINNTGVDIFDVWPADPRYLISVSDAGTALQWRQPDWDKNGATLALYVAAATEVIEDITGAILIRTIVQPSDGGRSGILLWERPSSVASVTVNGSPYTSHVVNLNAAIVYADGNGGRFPDGRQNIVVTYQVGTEAVPPSIQLATRELVRHLWQVGQQALTDNPPQAYGQNPEQTGMTRTGFAVPNRVIELCGNRHALPGLA